MDILSKAEVCELRADFKSAMIEAREYMNWCMEYRGVESLTAEDKRFLFSFNSCKEFEDYCFLNISEDWFLSNGNITFDMVLKELRSGQL